MFNKVSFLLLVRVYKILFLIEIAQLILYLFVIILGALLNWKEKNYYQVLLEE